MGAKGGVAKLFLQHGLARLILYAQDGGAIPLPLRGAKERVRKLCSRPAAPFEILDADRKRLALLELHDSGLALERTFAPVINDRLVAESNTHPVVAPGAKPVATGLRHGAEGTGPAGAEVVARNALVRRTRPIKVDGLVPVPVYGIPLQIPVVVKTRLQSRFAIGGPKEVFAQLQADQLLRGIVGQFAGDRIGTSTGEDVHQKNTTGDHDRISPSFMHRLLQLCAGNAVHRGSVAIKPANKTEW